MNRNISQSKKNKVNQSIALFVQWRWSPTSPASTLSMASCISSLCPAWDIFKRISFWRIRESGNLLVGIWAMAKSYRGTERAWATIRHSRCAKSESQIWPQKNRISRMECAPGRGHPACCCCQAAPLRQGTHLLQLRRPPWYGLGYFLYFWELGWTYFWAIIGPFSALKKLNKFLTIETDWYSRMKYLGFVVREEGRERTVGMPLMTARPCSVLVKYQECKLFSKEFYLDENEYFLYLWWKFNLAIVMSARETHSCFGMEKNSTDLWRNCFVQLSS